jgi:hypothetical protein
MRMCAMIAGIDSGVFDFPASRKLRHRKSLLEPAMQLYRHGGPVAS